ncbi:M23 family metallopeptidase [Algiphilus sp.]|uniref:M23 family metallopeptidase n=1 Tax=Algiphilus sp. TaxID=1872431 RepID=UPI0032EC201C
MALTLAPAVSIAESDVPNIDLLPGSRLQQGGLLIAQIAPGARVFRDGEALPVDASGRFVTGFHRDDPDTVTLRWEMPDGRAGERVFPVTQREYDIQRIDGLPSSMVSPPQAVIDRIVAEAERVKAARAHRSPAMGVFEGFIWPVTGRVTSVYGSQRILNGKPRQPHYGLDIAAETGRPIRASAAGIVRLADTDLYYTGGTVIIDHGMGVSSTYLHMSRLDVAVGDRVEQGAVIGAVGATGRVTGPHLCFRYNWLDKRLDPALLLPEAQSQEAAHAQ